MYRYILFLFEKALAEHFISFVLWARILYYSAESKDVTYWGVIVQLKNTRLLALFGQEFTGPMLKSLAPGLWSSVNFQLCSCKESFLSGFTRNYSYDGNNGALLFTRKPLWIKHHVKTKVVTGAICWPCWAWHISRKPVKNIEEFSEEQKGSTWISGLKKCVWKNL